MNGIIPLKPKLFALLIGIDDYGESPLPDRKEISFPSLSKYLTDAAKVKSSKPVETGFDAENRNLPNQLPSPEVDHAFQAHFTKADRNDTALFSYSDQGSKENSKTAYSPVSGKGMARLANRYCKNSTINALIERQKPQAYLN